MIESETRSPSPAATTPTAGEAIYLAEGIEEHVIVVREHSLPVRTWCVVAGSAEWLFGFASLVVVLAVVASIPLLQFLSLGYLLEVSGRITRSGRFREGFFAIRAAGRVGSLFAGTWLMLLPLRFISDMAYSAELIEPGSGSAFGWRTALWVSTWLMLVHILMAWYCGGKLRHFLWPLLAPLFFGMWLLRHAVSATVTKSFLRVVLKSVSPRLLEDLTTVPQVTSWFPPAILWCGFKETGVGGMYVGARDAVWDFFVNLRLAYFFWLGLRGFAGALVWLFLPILLIVATTRMSLDNAEAAQGLGALLGLLGSLLLATVMLYLPFLQAHFAAERRMGAMFELREVRGMFRRAPIAFWFALLVTLLFALPLYLLKIEFIPREVLWLPSLVFVLFIFPARMITGWSLARARKRDQPRFFLFRWMSRLAAIPVVAVYVLILYLTQYTSWYGAWSLFEQHAVLTPVPFLGL